MRFPFKADENQTGKQIERALLDEAKRHLDAMLKAL
jgi:hypothetical protein